MSRRSSCVYGPHGTPVRQALILCGSLHALKPLKDPEEDQMRMSQFCYLLRLHCVQEGQSQAEREYAQRCGANAITLVLETPTCFDSLPTRA